MGDLVVVPEVEVLHEVLPVRVVPGRPVARPAPECVPALEVSLLLGLRHLAVPGGGECHIYRVSQKKGGITFRGRFEVFRGFKSKKFRRLTPI